MKLKTLALGGALGAVLVATPAYTILAQTLTTPVEVVEVRALSGGQVGFFTAVAACPVDTELVGGGFRTTDATHTLMLESRPEGNTWVVRSRALDTGNHGIDAYALCAAVDTSIL